MLIVVVFIVRLVIDVFIFRLMIDAVESHRSYNVLQ